MKCSSARGSPGQISSRSLVRGFLTLVDWWVAVGAALVTFEALPVDGFCRTTAVGGFLGVSIGLVAAGAAGGLGVAGATCAAAGAAGIGLTGNNPGEDSGVAGTTSVLVSMSCLTASGWRLQMWSHAHLYWPPQWLEPSISHVWLDGWLWLGARGSWHHWVQRQFVQHIAGTLACSDDHGM